jgi:hypothetical protein
MKIQMRKHRKLTAAAAAVLTASMLLAGCGSSSGSTSSSKNYGFKYVNPSQLTAASSSSAKSSSSASSGKTSNSTSSQSAAVPGGGSGGTPPDANGASVGGTSPSTNSNSSNGGTPPSGAPSSSSNSNGSAAPSGGGASDSTFDYSGSYSAAKTASGKALTLKNKTISASKSDQNVLLAKDGGTLKAKGVTLKKSGSDENGDNCNFYGLNASVLAVGSKTKAYISDSSITSTSTGSNGIFATDSAKVYANNVKITTKNGQNARGLDATYGGTIYANQMDISTAKEHCAALATDRGGGYISVTNSKLATKGSGSPLLYSTGDIEVENVTGTASGSQIAGMEGLNRILIYNSKLTSTNDNKSGSDPIKNGVILNNDPRTAQLILKPEYVTNTKQLRTRSSFDSGQSVLGHRERHINQTQERTRSARLPGPTQAARQLFQPADTFRSICGLFLLADIQNASIIRKTLSSKATA